MDFLPELYNLIFRFGFNLFIATIIIKLIYYRDPSNNDFVFTYFMFNSLIFFFAYLLGNIDINMGFAFGMFAVFAILRYRTDPIPIKEMTYLFIVITIGVINALSNTDVSYASLLFTNIALVILTFALEKYWQNNLLISRRVVYEKIENIKPENHDALLSDLKDRTGLDIVRFEVRRTDFLKDTVNIRVYYKE
jgi:vacuolar-type H+-ATPase subunit I/STV1